MHLAVVEPNAAGHHFAVHVRALAREATARGWRVQLVTTAAATRHPAYAVLQRALAGRLETVLLPDEAARTERRFARGVALELRRWHAFRSAMAAIVARL